MTKPWSEHIWASTWLGPPMIGLAPGASWLTPGLPSVERGVVVDGPTSPRSAASRMGVGSVSRPVSAC